MTTPPDPATWSPPTAEDVLDAVPQALGVLDADGVLRETNRTWVAQAAQTPDRLARLAPGDDFLAACRTLPRELAAIGEHVADGVQRVLDGRAPRFEVQYDLEADDTSRWFLLVATALASGATLSHLETTVHFGVHDMLAELAFHDDLTGLPNRSLVRDRIRRAMIRSQRTGAWPAIVFVDLDRFKAVNDVHGHDAGDAVLREVARRLAAAVREGDTCGRWGGDEFVVVLELSTPTGLTPVVDRLHRALSAPVEVKVGDRVVAADGMGLSIGVVVARGGERVEQLIRTADEAMYEAKRTHGGVYVVGL